MLSSFIHKLSLMENEYLQYYAVQVGGGLREVGPLYQNQRFVQKGCGFGSFFGALYRFFKPILHSGLNTLKNQAVKTGSAVLSEIGKRPFKDIILDHGRKAKDELHLKFKNKFQEGGTGLMFTGAALAAKRKSGKQGIKVKRMKLNNQSSVKRKKAKTSLTTTKKKKKSLQTRVLDIFSKK